MNMRVCGYALCIVLTTSGTLYGAEKKVDPAEAKVTEQKEVDRLGEYCYKLPTVLWAKVLTFLLGPHHLIWYSVDQKALPPFNHGNECGLGNGGYIITHNDHCVYSWCPHKNVWDPKNPFGLGGACVLKHKDTMPIAFNGDAVTLANYREKKIEISDSMTLRKRYEHPIDPALSYCATNADGNVMVAGDHPAIMKAVMKRLSISHANASTKKMLHIPDGAMPPLVLDRQGCYCALLDAESDSIWITDIKEAKVMQKIVVSKRCLRDYTKEVMLVPPPIRGPIDRKLVRIWDMLVHTPEHTSRLKTIAVRRFVDERKLYAQGAAAYDQKDDVTTVMVAQCPKLIPSAPTMEVDHGIMEEDLKSNTTTKLGYYAFIGYCDPALLTVKIHEQSDVGYLESADLVPLKQYEDNPNTMSLVLWDIKEGKKVAEKALNFPYLGVFACVTNERGRLFCTNDAFYSMVSDVRMPRNLNAMDWDLISFGKDNGDLKNGLLPLRRVHKLLMSPSGDWVMMREKQIKKVGKQFVECNPTMLYLGLNNKGDQKYSPVARMLTMRLYALQRASEQGGAVALPIKLQQAVAPPEGDTCTIA